MTVKESKDGYGAAAGERDRFFSSLMRLEFYRGQRETYLYHLLYFPSAAAGTALRRRLYGQVLRPPGDGNPAVRRRPFYRR